MSKLLTKIKSNKEATAYKYFEAEVELEEAEALATACDTIGDTVTAATIRSFIAKYNGDEVEAPQVKVKAATTEGTYQPYHDNGGLGMLDYYADEVGFEFDPMKMQSSRFRVKRGSSNEVRAKYLAKLWHEAIETVRENEEQNWFTRIVRHQISALIKGDARKKYLKNIPMPKDA